MYVWCIYVCVYICLSTPSVWCPLPPSQPPTRYDLHIPFYAVVCFLNNRFI